MDSLSPLLERFTLSVRVFHAGVLCNGATFADVAGLGTVHLLRRGRLTLEHGDGMTHELAEPSVIFFPQPCRHRFRVDPASGAELTCATVDFGARVRNPVLLGLPLLIIVPIHEAPTIESTLGALFDEAFHARLGRQAALDRLMEYVLLVLLRHALDAKRIDSGVLAALADGKLSKALIAMHERPERPWSLDELAREAGMSRARFAVHFRAAIGATPGDYLTDWRIAVAQVQLRRGNSLKMIAPRVGYASTVTLARVFARRVGMSPAEWLTAATAPAGSPVSSTDG